LQVVIPYLFNPDVTNGEAPLASEELAMLVAPLYKYFMYHLHRVCVGDGEWGSEAENDAALKQLLTFGKICEKVRFVVGVSPARKEICIYMRTKFVLVMLNSWLQELTCMCTANLHLSYCWARIVLSSGRTLVAINDMFVEGGVQLAKGPVRGSGSHNLAKTATRALFATANISRECFVHIIVVGESELWID